MGLLEVNRHAGIVKEENFGIMGHGGSVVLKDGNIRFKPMDEDPEDVPIAQDVSSKHEHFLECLQTGDTPLTGIEDAIDTLKVCLAFNRSAETNTVESA